MRPGLIVTAAALGSIALAGCFTTSADYQHDAENFILTDQGLADALGTDETPLTFDSATCEKPDSQDPGTTFTCTAIDDNGADWQFSVEIKGESRYEVNVARDPRTQRD